MSGAPPFSVLFGCLTTLHSFNHSPRPKILQHHLLEPARSVKYLQVSSPMITSKIAIQR